MGYIKPDCVIYSTFFLSSTPLDSTVYYFGNSTRTLDTANDYSRIYILKDGIIRAASIFIVSTAATGTNENIIIAIRKNDTTDYTFSTVGLAVPKRVFSNYILNIPVLAGEFIEFKMTTPAWVTNPDGMRGAGHILIESA
jgi:hypothetical protein